MYAHEVHAREMRAYEVHAREMHAYEVYACEMQDISGGAVWRGYDPG